jgi:hypothetical protein
MYSPVQCSTGWALPEALAPPPPQPPETSREEPRRNKTRRDKTRDKTGVCRVLYYSVLCGCGWQWHVLSRVRVRAGSGSIGRGKCHLDGVFKVRRAACQSVLCVWVSVVECTFMVESGLQVDKLTGATYGPFFQGSSCDPEKRQPGMEGPQTITYHHIQVDFVKNV